MSIKKGDLIKLVEPMGMLTNVGEIYEVVNVSENGEITFKVSANAFGMFLCTMSADEFDRYFEKYEEPVEEETFTITADYIDEIMENTEIKVLPSVFGKCTVVAAKLPNGFVIVESSACVDPRNYDEDMGVEICMNKIINKVWELEGYRLQSALYEDGYDFEEEYDCEGCELCATCDGCDE